jgi:hypothetical protein
MVQFKIRIIQINFINSVIKKVFTNANLKEDKNRSKYCILKNSKGRNIKNVRVDYVKEIV